VNKGKPEKKKGKKRKTARRLTTGKRGEGPLRGNRATGKRGTGDHTSSKGRRRGTGPSIRGWKSLWKIAMRIVTSQKTWGKY